MFRLVSIDLSLFGWLVCLRSTPIFWVSLEGQALLCTQAPKGDEAKRKSRLGANSNQVTPAHLAGPTCASLTGVCVSLSLPQEVSQLELTLQASKQNDTQPQEVLLVLVVNKNVFVQLQALGISLQLACVSVTLTQDKTLVTGGPCWSPLWVMASCPSGLASFHSNMIHQGPE
jgi:hypothetical protein